jgi:hypothetical protein
MPRLRLPENLLRHRLTRQLFYGLVMYYAWSWFSTNEAMLQKIGDGLDGLLLKAPYPFFAGIIIH